MQNKRGQGLSTTAIILIVLGVAVLAILILGFIIGWDKIAPWLSGDNVDTISTQCGVACSIRGVYDFCTKTRELKAGDLPDAVKSVTLSCFGFGYYNNKEGESYGIGDCPGLCSQTHVWVAIAADCDNDQEEGTSDSLDACPGTKPTESSVCCKLPS